MSAPEVTNEDLNALQGNGVISDLCVSWADVAEIDRPRALAWLAGWKSGQTLKGVS